MVPFRRRGEDSKGKRDRRHFAATSELGIPMRKGHFLRGIKELDPKGTLAHPKNPLVKKMEKRGHLGDERAFRAAPRLGPTDKERKMRKRAFLE